MGASLRLVVAGVAVVAVGLGVWKMRGDAQRARAASETDILLVTSALNQHCSRWSRNLASAAEMLGAATPNDDGGTTAERPRWAAAGLDPSGKITTYAGDTWLAAYSDCAFPRDWQSDQERDANWTSFGDLLMKARQEQGPALAQTLRRMEAIARANNARPMRRASTGH